MGQRGPVKKPRELALLHGDKKSRINDDAPTPAEGFPEPPYTFCNEARAVWNDTVEQLRIMRTVTPADRDLLVAYVEAVVNHRVLVRDLRANPEPMLEGVKGILVKNPRYAMVRDAATLVRVLAREFGLSPSARTDIVMGGGRTAPGVGPERLLS